jgi:hypothetical protein
MTTAMLVLLKLLLKVRKLACILFLFKINTDTSYLQLNSPEIKLHEEIETLENYQYEITLVT